MSAMAAHISGVSSIYSTVRWSGNQRKHQSSASLAFVNSPHNGPVTWKMFPFDDVIMTTLQQENPWALDTLGNLRRQWQTCADTARGWNDLCCMSLATTPHVEYWPYFNTLRPRQNGRLFADDTFKRIFLNKNIRISTKISLKFVPKGLINNIAALVQIMAWRRPGDRPLSEPMMISLLTHICVTRPQWVNKNWWYGLIKVGDCAFYIFRKCMHGYSITMSAGTRYFGDSSIVI